MSTAEQILTQVESYREQIVEAMRKLTAIQALDPTSGGQGELEKALMVEGWLKDMGMETERIDSSDERVESGIRPNIAARMPGGTAPARWVLSHLDVVPTGALDLWSSDPWKLRVEGDYLYGRGTSDNHQGLLSSFFGLQALIDLGIEPAGPANLIVVADEETGSGYGLEYVLENRSGMFSPEDLIVVPDFGEADGSLIEVAEKSMIWIKVQVIGKQVHGSMPEKGVNALYASARMMVAVREMYQRFDKHDPIYSPPTSTFEPTKKEAGVPNVNTIPGHDVFYIDCRVLPEYRLEDIEAAFRERFAEIAAEEGARVEISHVQHLQAPPPTPADAPVVQALAAAIERVHGIKAAPCGVGGGTVAAFFRQRDLPVAVWSTLHETAHMPDEYCLLSDLVKDAQVFGLIFAGV